MSWKASSDTNRLTEATQVVHQGIPMKLYFGAIKGTGLRLIRAAECWCG